MPGGTMKRRSFLQLAASAAALPFAPHIVRAQAYPAHPIRLIVGFPAGGQVDIIARLAALWLGNLGAEAVVNAAPDGYTLFFAAASNTVNTTLFPNLPYDFARDTAPVGTINRIPLVLEVNPTFEAQNVASF